jgi:hypothetical protein
MDKKLKYQQAILAFLEEYAKTKPVGWKNVQNQVIADKENHHYQLTRLGWVGDEHIHYTVFHLDIIGDKVWVQENRTDLPISDELEDLGIAPDDIVFAFMEPELQSEAAAA